MGATKCSAPIGAEWDSPYNGSLGADPLVRGQVAFALELKAL